MSLIFDKYIPVGVPSDFLIGSVLAGVRMPYLVTKKNSYTSGRFAEILRSKTHRNIYYFDRVNILFNFSSDAGIVFLFERDSSEVQIVQTISDITRVVRGRARAFHIILPYVRIFSLLDFLGQETGLKKVCLIENSDIAYLTFIKET